MAAVWEWAPRVCCIRHMPRFAARRRTHSRYQFALKFAEGYYELGRIGIFDSQSIRITFFRPIFVCKFARILTIIDISSRLLLVWLCRRQSLVREATARVRAGRSVVDEYRASLSQCASTVLRDCAALSYSTLVAAGQSSLLDSASSAGATCVTMAAVMRDPYGLLGASAEGGDSGAAEDVDLDAGHLAEEAASESDPTTRAAHMLERAVDAFGTSATLSEYASRHQQSLSSSVADAFVAAAAVSAAAPVPAATKPSGLAPPVRLAAAATVTAPAVSTSTSAAVPATATVTTAATGAATATAAVTANTARPPAASRLQKKVRSVLDDMDDGDIAAKPAPPAVAAAALTQSSAHAAKSSVVSASSAPTEAPSALASAFAEATAQQKLAAKPAAAATITAPQMAARVFPAVLSPIACSPVAADRPAPEADHVGSNNHTDSTAKHAGVSAPPASAPQRSDKWRLSQMFSQVVVEAPVDVSASSAAAAAPVSVAVSADLGTAVAPAAAAAAAPPKKRMALQKKRYSIMDETL